MAKPWAKIFHHSKSSTNTSTTSDTPVRNLSDQPLTIVELFQSQGCNSCPPTNANLLDLVTKGPASTSNILLLTYQVTYWDYLGWTDTFGQETFNQRQRDYVNHMGLRSAFTPQVVVNGRSSGVGNTQGDLVKVLEQGVAGDPFPVKVFIVSHDRDEVVVSVPSDSQSSSDRKLHVSLVTYDARQVDVSIPRGENAGRTLSHINVVKDMKLLSQAFASEEQVFALPQPSAGLSQVILVQDGKGGYVVGAVHL